MAKRRVLVAPLDWGLGHATRCIPLIRYLLQAGCTVFIAAEGKAENLLKQEFPHLTFLPLHGYRIRYASAKWSLVLRLLLQVPKILVCIYRENKWLQKVVSEQKIEVVISDNRYGLYHAAAYTIFMTHQLGIKTPFPFFNSFIQKLNYRFIERFHECWVPDDTGNANLAGALSHPGLLPDLPVYYVGLLSRFRVNTPAVAEKHLLILLSGPEPQRTILENKILAQLPSYKLPVLLVRGLPGATCLPPVPQNITVVNHLPAVLLQQAVEQATYVIGRCGYSTVMDLMVLQKKSILIPTPGQTEQEYLAVHLLKNNWAFCVHQHQFRLLPALSLAAAFPYQVYAGGAGNVQDAISRMLAKLEIGQWQ